MERNPLTTVDRGSVAVSKTRDPEAQLRKPVPKTGTSCPWHLPVLLALVVGMAAGFACAAGWAQFSAPAAPAADSAAPAGVSAAAAAPNCPPAPASPPAPAPDNSAGAGDSPASHAVNDFDGDGTTDSCLLPDGAEAGESVRVTLADGSVVIGARQAESEVDEADVQAIQGVIPGFSCDVRAFYDIPFAQPPVGDLRWRRPQPIEPLGAEYDARQQRANATCAQADKHTGGLAAGSSEDCLYLSIYQPENQAPGETFPVMLWIYGGGFRKGSPDSYDGTALAAINSGAVVVTMSYRVGIFGFLGPDEMRSRDPLGSTGNYGLLDQRAAMEWVKKNIAGFGGDPDRVMIFGQSAGAASTSLHTVLPKSWPYFNKAAMDSGAFVTWAAAKWEEKTLQYPDYTLEAMAKRLGCDAGLAGEDIVTDCFVPADTEAILRLGSYDAPEWLDSEGHGYVAQDWATDMGITNQFKDAPVFGPTIDCVEVAANPLDLLKSGQYFGGPIIIGSNHDESATKGADRHMDDTASAFAEWAQTYVQPQFTTAMYSNKAEPDIATALAEHYPISNYHSFKLSTGKSFSASYQAAFHAQSDCRYSCPAHRAADIISARGDTVYHYLFNAPSTERTPFATHGSDIKYIYLKIPGELKVVDQETGNHALQLSAAMATYWTNFAATGDPNQKDRFHQAADVQGHTFIMPGGLPDWPSYSAAGKISVELSAWADHPMVIEHAGDAYSQGQCPFWETLVPDPQPLCVYDSGCAAADATGDSPPTKPSSAAGDDEGGDEGGGDGGR